MVYDIVCEASLRRKNLEAIEQLRSRHSNIELSMTENWLGKVNTNITEQLALCLVNHKAGKELCLQRKI